MSINRRTAIAVRSIGVASAAAALALGVAGNAFACNIGDFTASATCDTDSGQGSITVVDTDASRPVVVTVFQNGTQVATQTFDTNGGDSLVVPLQWSPSTTYSVHVKVGSITSILDKDITGGVTTPAQACASSTPSSPPASPSPSPSSGTPSSPATASPSSPATPSSTSTSSAPAAAGSNAPSPAAGGSQNLAETGGGSNTGMIAGVAAVLVAAGGGTIFALRRRNPAARH